MENKNKNEVISYDPLFYDIEELEFKPNQNEYNSVFLSQRNYGHSIKEDPLNKKSQNGIKTKTSLTKKFQKLAPNKLKELFFDLQVELEMYQLQRPSSHVENFELLKKFYAEIVKQVRDNIFESGSTSKKNKLWKHFYRFSDLKAPYPKTLKLKTKSGELKETEFPVKYFMIKTENFVDKSKENWIKKPLILLKKTKLKRKDIIIEKSWKLDMKSVDLELRNQWNNFLVERARFEKAENLYLSNYFLLNLLNAFNTSESNRFESLNKDSIKVVKVWQIIYDSVLSVWVFFMEKEYYQKFKEEALQNKQIVRNFPSYKKTISVKNLNKEWKNQADLLCQDEKDCQDESDFPDFTTYLELSLDEVASLKEEKIEKFGKLAALRERLYLVSQPLLAALINSKLLIFEDREDRNKKNFEQDKFLTLEEVKNLKSNTLLLNLNVNQLNQSFFKKTFKE